MKKIIYRFGDIPSRENIYDLYSDVGWVSYIEDFESLLRGMDKSLDLVTAWDKNQLVGLIRVVGDGETIIYVQDLLVAEAYQSKGIGSELLNLIFDRYRPVRQKILTTDRVDKNIKFYSKNGMRDLTSLNCVSFMYLVR